LSTDVSEVRAASIIRVLEAARTSETSVDYYFTQHYIPEDKSELHTRRRENLKSRIHITFHDSWFVFRSPIFSIVLNYVLHNFTFCGFLFFKNATSVSGEGLLCTFLCAYGKIEKRKILYRKLKLGNSRAALRDEAGRAAARSTNLQGTLKHHWNKSQIF
jgi:hypothetical protein